MEKKDRIPKVNKKGEFKPLEQKEKNRLLKWKRFIEELDVHVDLEETSSGAVDPKEGIIMQVPVIEIFPGSNEMDETPYVDVDFLFYNKARLSFIGVNSYWESWIQDYIKKSPLPITDGELCTDDMSWEKMSILLNKFLNFVYNMIPPLPEELP